jgi:23S rRNA (adenine2503-C2)-methyltransferase
VEAARAVVDWCAGLGLEPFRARQILPRLWERPVGDWSEATDLPGAVIAELKRQHAVPRPTLAARRVSSDGTIKYLWRFADGAAVESVLIPEGRRRTLCVSSQAGCAFGCVFCATGRMGLGRHLAPWEITAQVRELALDAAPAPSNVVFMGMGEPLHNWNAVDVALSILNHHHGLGLGARHLTVSTVGIVPGLRRLAQRPEQFRVALSLHSPFTERRRALMPVERKYPLPDVLGALGAFRRRVTFEYVMIRGRNDRPEDAAELARIARDLEAHVNLLPLHPGGAPDLEPTPAGEIETFAGRLRAAGANVTVRRSRGLDIEAACGQLRIAVAGRGVTAEPHGHVDQQRGVGGEHDAPEAERLAHDQPGGRVPPAHLHEGGIHRRPAR